MLSLKWLGRVPLTLSFVKTKVIECFIIISLGSVASRRNVTSLSDNRGRTNEIHNEKQNEKILIISCERQTRELC